VLLVDDDARPARTLAHMLGEDGYSVELAFDGASAIERIGRVPELDVLVLDYMLPHVNGLAVASYARSRWKSIPIIFLTSYLEVLRRATSTLSPPIVLLCKPLSYGDLTRELDRIVPVA